MTYEIRVYGSQYVITPKGYDPLRHGGIAPFLVTGRAFGSRKAADKALAKLNGAA